MLKVQIRSLGTVAIICLDGRVSRTETGVLRNALISLPAVHTVVFDLARVSLIDAGGLGVLLDLRQETQAQGIEFKLTNATERVRRVIQVARLDSVLEVTSRETFRNVSRDSELASQPPVCA